METGIEVRIEYLTKWLMISKALMLVTSAFLRDHGLLYLSVFNPNERTLDSQVRGFVMWL